MLVDITLDLKKTKAKDGENLIDLLIKGDKKVPHVCYHEQLGSIKTCDTCMVEVDGQLVRACETKIRPGMLVETKSHRAKEAQTKAFQHTLANHLMYCTVCDNNNGNCRVHNDAENLGIKHQTIEFKPKPHAVDNSNPFYRYDPDQCVLCGRCVEACQNVEVNETLSIDWEAKSPRVVWDGGKKIGESSCVSCGHCVTVCPCNALMEKSMIGKAGFMTNLPSKVMDGMIDVIKALEPDTTFEPLFKVSNTDAKMRESRVRRTKTVCTYCGVGCSFDIWTRDRHILKVVPEKGPANGISTCVKGKFGQEYVNSKERLTTPLIRDGFRFREATWEEALNLIASKFYAIKRDHGPDALSFVASSKCTNEEAYLMQKFARAVIGTNNIDNCSRYCQSPATKGLVRTLGLAGDTGSIHDMTLADLVITVGSNTAESHPVIASRVKAAHKLRAQKLIVIDIRKHEMAERADTFLQPKPGTDLIWASALSKYILDEGLEAKEFLKTWVTGLDDYKKSLAPFTLEFAAEKTGLSTETLKQLAHEILKAKNVCLLWAMGVTQHSMGSDTSTAFANLMLVTGNFMRPGTGCYPLRGHNNVQGTGDHGADPENLPGYEKVADEEARKRVEDVWQVKIPTTKGLDNHEMIDAIHEGKLKSMYVVAEEINLVESNINYVNSAFEKLDFLVVQDIYFTKTCQMADVVLPGAPSLEKDGTFTNTERRIQRLYKIWDPLDGSRADWVILQDLANAMGAHWDYGHPSEIYDEIAKVAPKFAGINYERLAGYKSLQWPVKEDGTDSPLLYKDGFNVKDNHGKAFLFPLELREAKDKPDETYDLHLNNGRLLEHFHEGAMTYKVPGIAEQVPDTFIEVSPELARERGIVDGTRLRLTSRYGQLEARALVTDRVKGKELYMPINSSEDRVNLLTGVHVDHATHTPAYKETSVRMDVLKKIEKSPLPKTNHRYQQRTPQAGVEVERKWKRPDYVPFSGAPLPPKAGPE